MKLLSTLLTGLFVGLKLTGHIAWSWWLVLAPLWAPIAVVVLLAALCATIETAREMFK